MSWFVIYIDSLVHAEGPFVKECVWVQQTEEHLNAGTVNHHVGVLVPLSMRKAGFLHCFQNPYD
jgi:hypothetical protein